MTADSLKSSVDRLLKAGVLIQPVGQSLQCHPLLSEIATRDAVEAEQFEAMAAVMTYD
ncbi:MAG: hypothetical protein NZ772_17805 [Cyanobacteria bacterium]|nr:hypothetical protein [Cyanobacteriota bacterium]MDW8203132.1 hypothetical protein [Cyanobacteriota bacterium SKYGB_h_bin112]